jgi:5-formyltetrahydrofolate cyclo-ligase
MIPEDIPEIRRELRQTVLAIRETLDSDFRHRSSVEIAERLMRYLAENQYRVLHCYISFRSEVETRAFIENALLDGIRMIVPVVEQAVEHADRKERLVHTEIRGISGLAKGRFGLEEPVEREPSSLESLDRVIVPIVAFDRRGTRLGYGKGFYDVFLRELPRSVERIGLAFSAQEVDHIPRLAHDEPLDTIITELEIIHAIERC